MSSGLAQAGGVVGSLGLLALLLGTRRSQRLVGFGGWAVGMVVLALYLAPHGHRGVLAGAAVVGLLLAGIGAAILVRFPWVLPFVALAALPARIPVHVGSTEANLLLPLYGVVAAAALALLWELPTEERQPRELGAVALPLGLWIGWSGVSILWTNDLRQAGIELVFFVLPFGLLAVSLARLPWSRRGVSLLGAQLGLMAVIFAVVGIVQWSTRDVFWNPKVIVPNAYTNFFRVNSVFYDPSIYGRFLAVSILALLVVVLARPAPRIVAAAVVAIAVSWVGLYYSYSQSSLAALIVGVLIAAALLWRQRALLALGVTVVLVLAVAVATPQVRHTLSKHTSSSWNKATSGRASLVGNGVKIALHHPVAGVGIAGFKRAGESFVGRASAAFGIMIAAIAVHSLFYNALFEDPMFWSLLALAAVAYRTRDTA